MSSSPNAVDKISKRLNYITMMEGCGWQVGSARHTKMVQETVDGICTLVKIQEEIEPDVGIEIHEILKAKLEQTHIEMLMGLVNTKVALGKGGGGQSRTKQVNNFLDNYLSQPYV